LVGGLLGLAAGAAEFGVTAIPAAFVGGDLALHADEEFGGGRFGPRRRRFCQSARSMAST
jgi:hypothetical protein